MPTLYRHILKAAKQFPSIKRDVVLQEIKLEFRANKVRTMTAARQRGQCAGSSRRRCFCAPQQGLTSEDKIKQSLQLAVDGLRQLEDYSGLSKRSDDWSLFLRGSATGIPSQ